MGWQLTNFIGPALLALALTPLALVLRGPAERLLSIWLRSHAEAE